MSPSGTVPPARPRRWSRPARSPPAARAAWLTPPAASSCASRTPRPSRRRESAPRIWRPQAAWGGRTALAVRARLDHRRAPEAFAGGFRDALPWQLFGPRMVRGLPAPPLGHIATMLKDLDTVIDVARDTSSPVPMAGLAAQLFRLAKSARGADADALEIYKLSAKQVG